MGRCVITAIDDSILPLFSAFWADFLFVIINNLQVMILHHLGGLYMIRDRPAQASISLTLLSSLAAASFGFITYLYFLLKITTVLPVDLLTPCITFPFK